MREIKFRAWHKKYKKMYKVLHLHMETDIWATVEGRNCIEDKDIHIQIQPNDIEMMQYTGLNDKNGKEIYEGDISQCGSVEYEIRWVEKSAKFGAKVIKSESVLIRGCTFPIQDYVIEGTMMCNFEVIGNIYEPITV